MAKNKTKQPMNEIDNFIRKIRYVDIEYLVDEEISRFLYDNFELDRTRLVSPTSLFDWFQEYQEENKPSADFVQRIELALSAIEIPPDVFISFDFWKVD